MHLLAPRKIEHLVRILDEDRPFCLGLCDVQGAGEHRYARTSGFFYGAYWEGVSMEENEKNKKEKRDPPTLSFPPENHPPHHPTRSQTPAQDLDDAHIIDVEVGGVGGHNHQRGLCYEAGEDVFGAVLFRSEDGAEGGG